VRTNIDPVINIRFVYQVVVPKALAPKDLVKVYESGEMTVLPPWDPMVCYLCLDSQPGNKCPSRVPWLKDLKTDKLL
jgi:Peptidase C1-like family